MCLKRAIGKKSMERIEANVQNIKEMLGKDTWASGWYIKYDKNSVKSSIDLRKKNRLDHKNQHMWCDLNFPGSEIKRCTGVVSSKMNKKTEANKLKWW